MVTNQHIAERIAPALPTTPDAFSKFRKIKAAPKLIDAVDKTMVSLASADPDFNALLTSLQLGRHVQGSRDADKFTAGMAVKAEGERIDDPLISRALLAEVATKVVLAMNRYDWSALQHAHEEAEAARATLPDHSGNGDADAFAGGE